MNGEPMLPCSEILPVMEANLLDPEEVLANEAFPRDSPRPGVSGTLDRPSPLFIPGCLKKLGVGKSGFMVDRVLSFLYIYPAPEESLVIP
jgi:hypothetical protein